MNVEKNKWLILAWGVYPSKGGSTIIVNNIAEGFDKDELVIAGQIPAILPEKRWESFSDIPLIYLNPFPFGFRRPARYIRWLKLRSTINHVKKIVKKNNIDNILTVFPDEFYSYVALRVAKELGLPFDIWFHNSYLENRTGILRQLAKRIQPRLFSDARRVFTMSDGLNSEMKKLYPAVDFKTLTHGFSINKPEIIDVDINTGDTVKFLYSGSLNDSCLDASIRIMEVIRDNPKYELHIFSGNPSYVKSLGIEGDNVMYHEFVPVSEFTAGLKNYDIMLLPHGIDGLRSAFEFKTIFPTRTIPLLVSGKPILAHSPDGSFLTEFLDDKKCAKIIVKKSKSDIERAIVEMISSKELRRSLVENAMIASSIFNVVNVVESIQSTGKG